MEIHSFKDLSCGKCPRNFKMVLFRIASLAAFLPLLTKSLSNDWGDCCMGGWRVGTENGRSIGDVVIAMGDFLTP